jgi:simple sugar transport system substrate-binding protein
MNPKTILKSVVVILATSMAFGMPSAQAKDKLKVGYVYVGPIGNHGWTYQHDLSRRAIEKAFGDKVKTTYVENVPEGADAERVIRKLAASGNDLIFTTSFGYMNPTIKVAKMFPKVKFEHCTGYKRAKNVSTYNARFYEGRYVAGTIAGEMTKSNIVGYIASFPIPEVVRGINSTIIAMRKVNPKAVLKVVWVNSWYDPGKEGDAAKALIDQGADVIMQHTDSTAPMQIAEKRGVYGVGQASDMSSVAPHAQLTAIIDNWSDYAVSRAKAVMDGTWKSQDTWWGLKEGMVKMAPFNPVIPAKVKADAEKVIAGIKSGEIKPFTGPIKDVSGKLRVPAGKSMTDGELATLNWYAEGVEGGLSQ